VHYLDANGKPIPTSKLTHPDMPAAERQRLQSLQDKFNAENRAYHDANDKWPDPPPGVDRNNPAVQGLLPPGFPTRTARCPRRAWTAPATTSTR
jgi:hypothetical protein